MTFRSLDTTRMQAHNKNVSKKNTYLKKYKVQYYNT